MVRYTVLDILTQKQQPKCGFTASPHDSANSLETHIKLQSPYLARQEIVEVRIMENDCYMPMDKSTPLSQLGHEIDV